LKSGSLDLLEPSGPAQACNGIALLLEGEKRQGYINELHDKLTVIVVINTPCFYYAFCTRTYNRMLYMEVMSEHLSVTQNKYQN